jgi:hypothetical protein
MDYCFSFFLFNAVLKVTVDFRTLLICAEGARLLENAIAFSSCVGRFEDVIQCPAGGRDRGDPAHLLAPRSRKSGSALYSPDKRWRA